MPTLSIEDYPSSPDDEDLECADCAVMGDIVKARDHQTFLRAVIAMLQMSLIFVRVEDTPDFFQIPLLAVFAKTIKPFNACRNH